MKSIQRNPLQAKSDHLDANAQMPGKEPPALSMEAGPEAGEIKTELDRGREKLMTKSNGGFSNADRQNLDMGSNMGRVFRENISDATRANLMNWVIVKVEQLRRVGDENAWREKKKYFMTFDDFATMLDEIVSLNRNSLEAAFCWSVFENQINNKFSVANNGINPNVIDSHRPENSHNHAVVDFRDGYHARLGGIQGDANVELSSVRTPRWANQAYMDALPGRDSMSQGSDKISTAYAEILDYEHGGWPTGGRGDAEASMATVETLRRYRMGGFSAFADEWKDRMLD